LEEVVGDVVKKEYDEVATICNDDKIPKPGVGFMFFYD
jgi:hypothetical protein